LNSLKKPKVSSKKKDADLQKKQARFEDQRGFLKIQQDKTEKTTTRDA